MATASRVDRHQGVAARLDELALRAAQDPEVPAVMGVVAAPDIGFVWRSSRPGARATSSAPLDIEAPFRIASVSKLFVAGTVLHLVQAGRLLLESPVSGWLSDETCAMLTAAGHDGGRIMVDHLLTHTSGLADHASLPEYAQAVMMQPARRWSRTEQLALALKQPAVSAAPGLISRYSDTGYVLLGEIIERVTGLPLGVAVRQCIDYRSLGLHHTWWEGDEAAPPDLLPRMPQWLGAVEAKDFDPSFDRFGGGGIVSTLGDLVRFASELFRGSTLLQPGTLTAACLVPACGRDTGTTVHSRLAMSMPMGRSWGWGHLGYWGCGVAHCPSLNITVAATINQPYPADPAWRSELVSRLGGIVVDLVLEELG